MGMGHASNCTWRSLWSSDWLHCYYGTEWAEQPPDAQYIPYPNIHSQYSYGISVYAATKLGGQCNMTCWYIRSPLSMNFSYPQLTVFCFLALSYTAMHVGGQCNLICWYMGKCWSLWEHCSVHIHKSKCSIHSYY